VFATVPCGSREESMKQLVVVWRSTHVKRELALTFSLADLSFESCLVAVLLVPCYRRDCYHLRNLLSCVLVGLSCSWQRTNCAIGHLIPRPWTDSNFGSVQWLFDTSLPGVGYDFGRRAEGIGGCRAIPATIAIGILFLFETKFKEVPPTLTPYSSAPGLACAEPKNLQHKKGCFSHVN